MKNLFISTLVIPVFLMSGCKSGSTAEGTSTAKSESDAVCVWDNISLKEKPEEGGKWISAISVGEKLTYLDAKAEDSSGKKTITYYNVQLKDGNKGWAQGDFIILASTPGVISQDCELYSRPDLLTKTDKKFSVMDIVAVQSEQGDFVQVTGKRKDGKWIESGWIKANSISSSDIDIAVAKYANKAMAITDAEKRAKAIKEIVDNPDYSGSIFISVLNASNDEKTEKVVDEPVASEDTTAKPE